MEQVSRSSRPKFSVSWVNLVVESQLPGEQYWDWSRRQAGYAPTAYRADYIVGALLRMDGEDLFDKPRSLMQMPLFRTKSHIIGRFMVGTETANVPLGGLD